jgi:hypothetical protein
VGGLRLWWRKLVRQRSKKRAGLLIVPTIQRWRSNSSSGSMVGTKLRVRLKIPESPL